MIAFFAACVPPKTSHHAKRIVRVGRFARLADKPELQAARATLDAVLLPHQPAAPLAGPVALSLDFTWPWLVSDTKRLRARGRVPHDRKPDCDNAAKAITDRLVALRFLEDDARVVELLVRKWRGDEAGIAVLIMPVAESPRGATQRARGEAQRPDPESEPSDGRTLPSGDRRAVRNEVGQCDA